MNQETSIENDTQSEALLLAAEEISIAGRPASRRRLLREAVRRGGNLQKAKLWYDRAVVRNDRGYVRDLSLPLTFGQTNDNVPQWLISARIEADEHAPYCAEELRYRLDLLQPGRVSDLSGPFCYVLHMSLPDNGSGYSVRSHHLVRGMQNLGMNIHCITRLGFPGDIGLPAQAPLHVVDNVRYHRILRPGKRDFANMAYVTDAAHALVEELAPLNPRAIMAASSHQNATPALLAARFLGVPFIYEKRGFWELSDLAANPQREGTPLFNRLVRMEAELARQADLVFTLTDAMRRELRRRDVENRAIHILPNAADPDALQPGPRNMRMAQKLGLSNDVPVIGYIGSFTLYEGLDDIVRACVNLFRRGHDFRLLMIGSEPSYLKDRIIPTMRQIATEGGIVDKLIMPGRISVDEVREWYSLIDIVPLPRKGMRVTDLVAPLKPLEAMAMEKAVVVSDLSALKEIVTHDETGLVVPHSDPEALADALARLIADPALRRSLGERARGKILTELNWDAVARKLRDTVDRVLFEIPASAAQQATRQ